MSQIEVMNQARSLADKLAGATTPVKANTLRSILADFMASPSPDPKALRRLLELLGTGSGGHLARSGSFPDQALAAIPILQGFLDATRLDPEPLRTLFGWTARLLLINRQNRRQPTPRQRAKAVGPPRDDSWKKPRTMVWTQALLSWMPNEGRLEASHGELKADTKDRTLLDALPPAKATLLTRRKKRKTLRCEATVRQRGDSWFELVAVRMPRESQDAD